MNKTSNKTRTKRQWLMPVLGSISLIDISLGSLFAGAAFGQGPEADSLAMISTGLLFLGCISLWLLSSNRTPAPPLTDHREQS